MASQRSFAERYGPWALVAGAGEGLGAAWARALAARGVRLVLVDRRPELLAPLVAELGPTAEGRVCDLGLAHELDRLLALARERAVGLLVVNAAASPVGSFLERPPAELEEVVAVNCRAPVLLCHAFGREMAGRGRGGLVLTGSLAGLAGNARLALYAASKAYALVLAEGLGRELRPAGVDVLCCLPGATDTPGFRAQQGEAGRRGGVRPMAPEAVVAEALDALGHGSLCVPGRLNRAAAFALQRLLPRRLAAALMSRMTERTIACPTR
ncbi:MAG TPA: SDR family NAD(P)-dependent oxidoreductase [Myxococcota bacterium]|nr:SDR family NAD(P)-dependent oxidoreductase [Myxococcota bacterium]HRY93277.1 SDR family NAD(P)-dependent oxidoreductase [Myxococcota bacterium]HSA23768.1 SDR family NAD(P)-dependent oxidoreductase [Myxococcota bacterium]